MISEVTAGQPACVLSAYGRSRCPSGARSEDGDMPGLGEVPGCGRSAVPGLWYLWFLEVPFRMRGSPYSIGA